VSLKRTTKQTEILTKQFDISEQARKESARPRLKVDVIRYWPPNNVDVRRDISFSLRNAGAIPFRVVSMQSQSGDTRNQDVTRSIELHPGYPAEVTLNVNRFEFDTRRILRVWFQIETSLGDQFRHMAEWEVTGVDSIIDSVEPGQFSLLKSELDKE
jgi:hypothetical protein